MATSCSRISYPKARLAESLQKVLQEDQLTASVRLIDHTLAVHLEHPLALSQAGGQIGIGPAFDDATRKVIGAIHRVLLSSDAEVRFYVVLLSDPTVPGAYLTLVRYMDDIRRANAQMLDTPEIFARTVLELNFLGSIPMTIDQYVPRDIRLEEFLSWQLARRIQTTLTDELQTKGVASVGRCGGRFEQGEFAFTLDVASPADHPLDEATLQEVFRASSNVIAKVLSSYKFEGFQTVRLFHPATGRSFLLPKTRLEVFR
ncbi:MAG: hypothetical protein AAB285_03435 [candidate division NC10 bacterium]